MFRPHPIYYLVDLLAFPPIGHAVRLPWLTLYVIPRKSLNFDSDLNQFGGVVDWTINDALIRTHDVKRA